MYACIDKNSWNQMSLLFLFFWQNLKTFPVDKSAFPVSSSSSGFLVPFDLPPTPYAAKGAAILFEVYSQFCVIKLVFYSTYVNPAELDNFLPTNINVIFSTAKNKQTKTIKKIYY